MKICNRCGLQKNEDLFDKGRNQCKSCRSEMVKKWKLENKDHNKRTDKRYYDQNKKEIQEYKKQWYTDNKEEILEDCRQYYAKNSVKIKKYVKEWQIAYPNYKTEYRRKNKTTLNKNRRKYEKIKKENDLIYKLRTNISRFVNILLKKNGSSKNGNSILKFLPYTIQELKEHLEKQFEPWMNWNNYGVYRLALWNDNDPMTWTWQIDHIVPSSNFKYTSMKEKAFQDCWSLDNLRPYSAKKNIQEGARGKVGFHV